MNALARLHMVLIMLVVSTVFAAGREKRIKRSELPPEVEKSVAAQSENATIHGFSQEKENGQTYYEAELIVAGHHKDVLMDAGGQVVEVEEEVALDSLPNAVRDSLLAKVGRGKLQKVESLIKHGKLVAYEAHVVVQGRHSEIQVGSSGETLGHQE